MTVLSLTWESHTWERRSLYWDGVQVSRAWVRPSYHYNGIPILVRLHFHTEMVIGYPFYPGHGKIITSHSFTQKSSINSSPPGQNGRFLQMIFSDAFSWMKSFVFWLKFHRSLFLRAETDNNPALVQIMGWGWIGDKPLSEPMLTWFTDAYMQH